MTGSCTDRVEVALAEADGRGRELNAVVTTLRDRALALAAASDERIAAGHEPRPLEGIPFAIKDVIDVEGAPTTAGSRVELPEAVARSTASLIEQLEALGAIPIAKTNCQEFSYGILGDESGHGRSVNPRDAALCTGGSSSGSAVLVAAGIVPFAVGTDTAGSARTPGAFCGVIGVKPTRGSLPDAGIFPLAPSFDTPGILATDAVLARAVTASLLRASSDADAGAQARGAAGHRAGSSNRIPPTLLAVDLPEEVATRIGADSAGLRAGTQRGDALRAVFAETLDVYDTVRLHEAFVVHRDLVREQRDRYCPGVLGKILAGERIATTEYERELRRRDELEAMTEELLGENELIVSPAVEGGIPRWDEIGPDAAKRATRWTTPWNALGWPAVIVPVPGATDALPALQIAGRRGADRAVLDAAVRLEQALAAAAG